MIRQEIPEMLMDLAENILADRNLTVRGIQLYKANLIKVITKRRFSSLWLSR